MTDWTQTCFTFVVGTIFLYLLLVFRNQQYDEFQRKAWELRQAQQRKKEAEEAEERKRNEPATFEQLCEQLEKHTQLIPDLRSIVEEYLKPLYTEDIFLHLRDFLTIKRCSLCNGHRITTGTPLLFPLHAWNKLPDRDYHFKIEGDLFARTIEFNETTCLIHLFDDDTIVEATAY
jgi:hypothetical protein